MDTEVQRRSFAELRRTRFANMARARDYEYIEQLANQTSTNIDTWDVEGLLEGVPEADRRAINKAFFAKMDTMAKAAVSIPDDVVEKLAQTNHIIEDAKKRRLDELQSNYGHYAQQAKNQYEQFERTIKAAWDCSKERMALEERPPNYIADELKELLTQGFWGFNQYNPAGIVRLETKNDIVMTEVNEKAGINRRINLGKFLGELDVKRMKLRLLPYKDNIVLNSRRYHPYVDRDGEICWGNAATTASKMLTNGKVHSIYNLLSALLVTYDPTSTPWEHLAAFDRPINRKDIATPGETHEESGGEECEICGYIRGEDCECHECEICGLIDEERCSEHYCYDCEIYSRRHCHECHNSEDSCTCCSICNSTDRDNCNCCFECEKTEDNCTRCLECDTHDGHEDNCSERVTEEAEPPQPAQPNEDIPF